MMEEMRRLTYLLALVATVVVAAVAAGCGGSAQTIPQLESLADVSSRSKAADSFGFALELRQQMLGMEFEIVADGAFDNAGQRGRMDMDLSSFAKLISGLGEAFGGEQGDVPPELSDPDAWKIELVVDGTQVFMRVPFLDSQLQGKQWVGGDLKELALGQGQSVDLGSLAATDPRDALDALEAVTGPLEVVGREEVRGVETTHYRTTLDPAKLADALESAAEGSSDLLSGFTQAMAQVDLSAVPIEVWVDDEGLLRKYLIDLELEQGGQSLSTSVGLELFDYGEPVSVDVPDPADVADPATLQSID
jgi:hypothetical protein